MSETAAVYTADQYRDWIRSQDNGSYQRNEISEKEWNLETEYGTGSIIFHEQDIIELIIVNKKNGENAFYLHFQLNEEEHAKSLFKEMTGVLAAMKDKTKLRVLLSCTSGFTTSFFASELNKAAENLKLDYEFSAVSFANLYEEGFSYDVILLAPQIHYQYKKTKEIFRRQTVLRIPASTFGGYKTGEVFRLILDGLHEKENIDPESEAVRSAFDNSRRILCIGMINHIDTYRIGYCIYDHGVKTLNKEVVKTTQSFQDILDLLDYVMARHENIDAIAIAYPGIVWHGRVDHPGYSMDSSVNIGRMLEERYQHKVILINDVNAMALGYHALHEDTDSMVFYFQPRGNYLSGSGIIIDGHLHRGYKGAAGESGRLTPAVTQNCEEKINTPEGALEIVGKNLLAYTVMLAPEKIVVYSALTPDMSEMRRWLSQYVKEEYIPELIWTDSLKEFILPGALIHTLDVLQRIERDPDYFRHLDEEAQRSES